MRKTDKYISFNKKKRACSFCFTFVTNYAATHFTSLFREIIIFLGDYFYTDRYVTRLINLRENIPVRQRTRLT